MTSLPPAHRAELLASSIRNRVCIGPTTLPPAYRAELLASSIGNRLCIGPTILLFTITRLVYFLYFADAFHKAAGNTSLLISATWEIEHHRK